MILSNALKLFHVILCSGQFTIFPLQCIILNALKCIKDWRSSSLPAFRFIVFLSKSCFFLQRNIYASIAVPITFFGPVRIWIGGHHHICFWDLYFAAFNFFGLPGGLVRICYVLLFIIWDLFFAAFNCFGLPGGLVRSGMMVERARYEPVYGHHDGWHKPHIRMK